MSDHSRPKTRSRNFNSRHSNDGFNASRGGGPRRFSNQRQNRPTPKYDPSLFIKKVEEQTVSEAYVPKHLFTDFAIEKLLKNNIKAKGYTAPTPIQDQVIPLLLEGRDVIACANTGTGKTAAFLIPLVHNVLTKKTNRVLIVAPTRELADQINAELKVFKGNTSIKSALVIGGASMHSQVKELKSSPAFVIGTPGRLLDLEQSGVIDFHMYDAIVLDEVDRMLDMGFVKDIKYIITNLPAKRHSLFFSATIPKELKGLMNGFLNNPVSVSVQTRQSSENVNQDVIKVAQDKKIETLQSLLIKPEFAKVIIFVRTKRAADKLRKALIERGFAAGAIHGDKTQAQRNKALEVFKAGKVKILVATDVVARGIDIDDISHVINYDLPQTYEDYIHRIGRTGRASKIGQALTFIE